MIEVVASEARIPGRCDDLEDPLSELQDRDIEGSAAEIVDEDSATFALI